MTYKTEQEAFWAGDFGDDYTRRSVGDYRTVNNAAFFERALAKAGDIDSIIEFGSNTGFNLRGLDRLYPEAGFAAIEINRGAVEGLQAWGRVDDIYNQSLLEFDPGERRWDLSFIKGVLIHINPEALPAAYDRLYRASRRYILIAEYYNRDPLEIDYRGHSGRLFKRDFAGEFLERFDDVELLDYGFVWHRDPQFPQDDLTWFLMQKR